MGIPDKSLQFSSFGQSMNINGPQNINIENLKLLDGS